MIFQHFSHIDPRLHDASATIEAEEVGLRVISACVFRVPFVQLKVTLMVRGPRRFNILEEFVMRAGLELEPAPTRSELADVLGLDQLFVDATYYTLEQLGAITQDTQDRLALTEFGQQCYAQGQVPKPLEEEIVSFAYLPATSTLTANRLLISDAQEPLLPGLLGIERSELEAEAIAVASNVPYVREATAAAALGLHAPAEGKTIEVVEEVIAERAAFIHRGICVVQDTILFEDTADNVSLRVVDISSGARDLDLEQALGEWIEKKRIGLADLMQPAAEDLAPAGAEPEPTAALPYVVLATNIYRDQTSAARRGVDVEQREAQPPPENVIGTVELLRDDEIRPRFLESLQQAQHTVLMISPWITEEAVDERMISMLEDMAQRRVVVLMGWGIARRPEREERVPPDRLLDRLHAIRTPDDVPAAIVWWVGNQHRKDVLIDQAIHLSGSHNWLSYRGDRLPRGESTYYVTVPEPVQSAASYLEPLFVDAASRAWDRAIGTPLDSVSTLEQCCVTWVVAGQAEEAIRRVQDLAQRDTTSIAVAVQMLSTICLTMGYLPGDGSDARSDLEATAGTVGKLARALQADCPEQLLLDLDQCLDGLQLAKMQKEP